MSGQHASIFCARACLLAPTLERGFLFVPSPLYGHRFLFTQLRRRMLVLYQFFHGIPKAPLLSATVSEDVWFSLILNTTALRAFLFM
jgi:hypothetical protein